jgi:hypothetical protein
MSNVDLARYNFFIFGVVLVLMMLLVPRASSPTASARRSCATRTQAPATRWGVPVPEGNGPTETPLLEARGITKVFGGLVAVNSVTSTSRSGP